MISLASCSHGSQGHELRHHSTHIGIQFRQLSGNTRPSADCPRTTTDQKIGGSNHCLDFRKLRPRNSPRDQGFCHIAQPEAAQRRGIDKRKIPTQIGYSHPRSANSFIRFPLWLVAGPDVCDVMVELVSTGLCVRVRARGVCRRRLCDLERNTDCHSLLLKVFPGALNGDHSLTAQIFVSSHQTPTLLKKFGHRLRRRLLSISSRIGNHPPRQLPTLIVGTSATEVVVPLWLAHNCRIRG